MNDLISRQDAINVFNEQIEQCNKALGSFDISAKDEYAIKVERASLKAYKEQLENLPSIQPKRGHWEFGDGFFENAICSCCEWDSSEPMEYAEKNFYFCPNCGADMRGNTNV